VTGSGDRALASCDGDVGTTAAGQFSGVGF